MTDGDAEEAEEERAQVEEVIGRLWPMKRTNECTQTFATKIALKILGAYIPKPNQTEGP